MPGDDGECSLGAGTVRVVRGRQWPSGARLMQRAHAKLRNEASLRTGKCSGQYMRNLYIASITIELAFLVMW